MMSSCGMLRRYAIFARRKLRKVLFRRIDHRILCWPCCWPRCWMLQEMDHMEASWISYVKVGGFDQFEQTEIIVLTVTSLGIVMLTVDYDLMGVLATGPKSRVGSGSGSTRNRTVATGRTTPKTQTVGNGPVSPPKTRHFKSTILARINYLSSDRIVKWSVRRLCSVSGSFTSRIQICDRTNIRWVAIENPRTSLTIRLYFTATQQISVRSQIWQREVKERLKLHNLRIDHVMIQSELNYLIGAKVVPKW